MEELKTCNNACGNAWCCTGDFFWEPKSERWTEESIEVSAFKGIHVYEWNPNSLVIRVETPCKHLNNCMCMMDLRNEKLEFCKIFPTRRHEGIILTETCCYYDPHKHISFEKLKLYKPLKK